jgi:hypothetical protein
MPIRQVPRLISDLYKTVAELNSLFPGRPFTPDGHLAGSIGEVVAAYVYELDLEPCSNPQSDARTKDGRSVQIKLTGKSGTSYGVRWSNSIPYPVHAEILLALKFDSDTGFQEIYNGDFPLALLKGRKDSSNGQLSVSISKLAPINCHLLPQVNLLETLNLLFASQAKVNRRA